MGKLVPLTCSRCNASLPAAEAQAGQEYVCAFCNHRMRWDVEPAAPPSAPATPAAPDQARLVLFIAGGAFIALAAGLLAWFTVAPLHDRPERREHRSEAPRPSRPPEPPVAPPTPPSPPPRVAHTQTHASHWSGLGPPLLLELDGRPLVITGMRDLGDDDGLRVAAFDPETGEQRWSTPSLGSYSNGYRTIHMTPLGTRVVVSDAADSLRMLDVRTGRGEPAEALTDHIQRLCTVSGRIWAEVADGNSVLFDPETVRTSPQRRAPPDCPSERFGERPRPPNTGAPGFAGDLLVEGEGLRAVIGHKQPGTEHPVVVGLAPSGRGVAWQTVLGTPHAESTRGPYGKVGMGALRHGRLAVTWKDADAKDDAHHLSLLDARNGGLLWDVALPPVFAVDSLAGVWLDRSFAYVFRTSCLEVHRLSDGKITAVIGRETWDTDLEPYLAR